MATAILPVHTSLAGGQQSRPGIQSSPGALCFERGQEFAATAHENDFLWTNTLLSNLPLVIASSL